MGAGFYPDPNGYHLLGLADTIGIAPRSAAQYQVLSMAASVCHAWGMAAPEKAKTKDGKPERKLDWGWRSVLGAILALLSLLQFVFDTKDHGFNWYSFVLMIGGLVVAGWIAGVLAAIAAGVSAWIILTFLAVAIGLGIVVGLVTGLLALGFGPMTFPFHFLFIKAPTAPAGGSCVATPLPR